MSNLLNIKESRLFKDIIISIVKNLEIGLTDPVVKAVENASRFQDNRRNSLHRSVFLHVALSGVSRLFAAPMNINRSFNRFRGSVIMGHQEM
jgi:hypothetical protein